MPDTMPVSTNLGARGPRLSNRLLVGLLLAHGVVLGLLHVQIKKPIDFGEVKKYSSMFKSAKKWQGQVAPDFKTELLGGEPFVLADRVGSKVIILNFFATWCGPCRAEMPELQQFYEERQDEVFLLGIDVEEREEVVGEFLSEMGVTFPVAIDQDGTVRGAYGAGSLPTTVVIGVDGRIHLYEAGRIANAEVSFGPLIQSNQALLKGGLGVSKERYLKLWHEQQESPATESKGRETTAESSKAAEPTLEGRREEIARRMDCPCGCEKKVSPCRCQTAKGIKKKLKQMELDGQTDEEIIKALNREFCIGARS